MGSVSEPARHQLYNRLKAMLGTEESETLMELLPSSQWHDLVTKGEVTELRGEMHIELAGIRAEMADGLGALRAEMKDGLGQLRTDMKDGLGELRGEMNSRFADVDANFARIDVQFARIDARFSDQSTEMQRLLRSQLMWTVSAITAMTSVLSGVMVALA